MRWEWGIYRYGVTAAEEVYVYICLCVDVPRYQSACLLDRQLYPEVVVVVIVG